RRPSSRARWPARLHWTSCAKYSAPCSRRGGLEIGRRQAAQQFPDAGKALLGRFELPAEAQLVRPVESIALRLILDQFQQLRGLDLRAFGETYVAAVGTGLNLGHTELLRQQLQRSDREQRLQRRRQEAEAIDQLHLQLVELGVGACVCDALVVHEAHVHV